MGLAELVSGQLNIPQELIRGDTAGNRVTILTTSDWLVSIQSHGRILNPDATWDGLSVDDRIRFLSPSTEKIPHPWIRVRIIVEPKHERIAARPLTLQDALHDKNVVCITPRFLNLSAHVSKTFYENSWKNVGTTNSDNEHVSDQWQSEALLSVLNYLYEPTAMVQELTNDVSTPQGNTTRSPSTTLSHPNVSPCYCVLDCPTAVLTLQPYTPHSMFHVTTYTQSVLTDNSTR
jgi:hypothetical protein